MKIKAKVNKACNAYIKAESCLLKELRQLPEYGNDCECVSPQFIRIDAQDNHECTLSKICLGCGGNVVEEE